MKEGASNCVERHLNLNDCDTSLLWTYSQVGRKCCFHSQRITPHASRLRYTARRTKAYVRVYTVRRWRVAIVNCDSRSRRWSRKGKARSEGSESGKPRRHIGLQKDLGYSRRSCEVRPCLAPPANDGATWPFPTSDATWELQACVQHWEVQVRQLLIPWSASH